MNYGFYQSYPYDHHPYEKRSGDSWPPPALVPVTPPPVMPVTTWPNMETGNVKVDRIHIAKDNGKNSLEVSTAGNVRLRSEPRLYPVYVGPPDTSPPIFTAIDVPTPLVDLTTRPGEVQADFAIDLPYNGFRFQSPTPVISA